MTQQIDYTSRDYAGIRQSLLDYAARTFPEWTSRSEGDFGVLMVELFAYMGDILSYYTDRVANEAYLSTATQRQSILNIAQMLGYVPAQATAATGTVQFTTTSDQATAVVIPSGTQVISNFIPALDNVITYETVGSVTVPPSGGNVTATVIEGSTQGTLPFTMNPTLPTAYTVNVNIIGVSNGLIAQTFALPLTPVVAGSVQVFIDDTNPLDNEPLIQYTQVSSLLDAGPTDNVFSVRVDDNQQVFITFGDGFNGTIPPNGVNVYATYRVGGGAYGNAVAGSVVDIATSIPGVTVTASSVMSGGQDPEGNEQIRANAPLAFQTQGRAVTLLDYQNLALGVALVSNAFAIANTYNNISVYILGQNGTLPSAALVAATQQYLSSRALIGSTVTVLAPTQVGINIGSAGAPVSVGVMPNANRASVLAAVTIALNNLFNIYSLGGARVALSDVYGAISNVPGVQYAIVPLLARADAVQSGTNDVLLRPSEIPIAGSINVTATGGLG